MNSCSGKNCKYQRSILGDCHISCTKPPTRVDKIGSGGDERYEKARRIAEENSSVVRCIWPGSGLFPISFDSNTIFGCNNFEEDK